MEARFNGRFWQCLAARKPETALQMLREVYLQFSFT